MKRWLIALFVLAGAAGGYAYYGATTSEFVPEISTVTVTTGDIVDVVGATGSLEAVTTVQVGSQVSGIIQALNVDYNSIVRRGDVIMRLDPSLFETQLEQARANLLRAEAEVERLRVAVDDARTQLRRAEDLSRRALIAATELEAAQVTLRAAEAQTKSAEAQVIQAQATLSQHEVNLRHTVIRAPIDGIVISRLVDIGQTVAASFQAPELFVIAADLTKMRVIANVDEADVGRIRPAQQVTFTVDAFPTEEFDGTVSQVRLEPVVQQNVVTYATAIDAPNDELKLKPGMTATVSIEIASRRNVVRVPSAAVRFRPTPAMFASLDQPVPPALDRRPGEPGVPRGRRGAGDPTSVRRTDGDDAEVDAAAGRRAGGREGAVEGGGDATDRRRRLMARVEAMSPEERERFRARMQTRRSGAPRADRPRTRAAATGRSVPAVERGAATIDALFAPLEVVETEARVWVIDDGRLTPVRLTLGVTDGTASELLASRGASLPPGTALVTSISTPDGAPGARGGSPLLPRFPFGQRRGPDGRR